MYVLHPSTGGRIFVPISPYFAKSEDWDLSQMKNLTGRWEFIFHKDSIYSKENSYFGGCGIPYIPRREYSIYSQRFNHHKTGDRSWVSLQELAVLKNMLLGFIGTKARAPPAGSRITFTSIFFQHKKKRHYTLFMRADPCNSYRAVSIY